MENRVIGLQASGVCWVDVIVHTLKRCEIGVDPWFRGIEDTLHNWADENIVKICTDVMRKILDAWENPMPVYDLCKHKTLAGILNLC